MRRNQGGYTLWILGLFSLGLLFQACQQTSADTSSVSRSENPTELQQSGAGRSGPLSQELDSSGKPKPAADATEEKQPREVVYVAETIKPTPAQLVSQDSKSRINVRSHPSTRSKTHHFGYPGDAVTLLQQAQGEGDVRWYYLRFDQSQAKGWIRADFIAQSSASVLPRQDYRPYNFDADPWLSSFNTTYAAAKQRRAPWLYKAPAVALKLAGYPNSDGCKPAEVTTTAHNANKVTVVIRNGPAQKEFCMDDSVLASQIRVDLVKENQIWVIEWAGGRYRCQRGRGQQDFAPTLCR
ncbi:SH3 domain-containing protein [Acaryochloris sp. IP29b_bin.148]|uniref:SH3 domain-containing protein n=1 Tax=Acaryochloris sp. IP29b_bin.148 TaxID=2969218 RepID=UPI002631043F|nr:SH3 domain-containing protein [Acaryochloris sp. IP29b_bin.148]